MFFIDIQLILNKLKPFSPTPKHLSQSPLQKKIPNPLPLQKTQN